jgi:hypothetical protein
LEEVLQHIDNMGISCIVCLGDVVGYNAAPNECVEAISSRNIQTILGNHDAVACSIEEPWGFNPVALSAAIWTREQLSETSLEWLRGLPDALNYGPFVAVHGAPKNQTPTFFLGKTFYRTPIFWTNKTAVSASWVIRIRPPYLV